MPKITYKPEGTEPRVWSISFGRFMSAERMVIERETGMTWSQVKGRLFQEDTSVTRAFLFVLLKREIPALRIDEVEFCEDDYELDATAEERAQAIEALEGRGSALTDDEREALEALRAEQAADEPAPKAAASTSESEPST